MWQKWRTKNPITEPSSAHNMAMTDTDAVPKPTKPRDEHQYCDIGTALRRNH
jgi:hypothetical protein